MIKLNKKLLTILILCFLAISSVALVFLFPEIKSDRVDAETTYNEYGLSVTEGASVRTTVDSVGIRFFGNYSSEALTSNGLATINNGKLTINEGVRLGMIIAPEKALDLTNDKVLAVLENHQTANGQANYYTLLNAAFGMSTTSYAVDFTVDNITVNNDNSITGRAAIVNIRDGNLKHAYKGITYFYTESSGYVYSDELTDGYVIKEVIDTFLREDYEVDEDAIPELRQIVAKSYAMEAVGNTNEIFVEDDGSVTTTAKVDEGINLKIGQSFDVTQLVSSGDTYEYSSYTENVNYNSEANTVTANGAGSVNLTVRTPYGVNLVYLLENEKILNIVSNGTTNYKVLYTLGTGTRPESTVSDGVIRGDLHLYLYHELNNYVGWAFSYKTVAPTTYSASDKYIVFGYNSYCELAGVENYVNPDNDSSYKIIVKDNSIFILGHENSLRFGMYGLLNKLIGYEAFNVYSPYMARQVNYNNVKTVSLGVSQIEHCYEPDIAYNIAFSQGNLYSNSLGGSLFRNASMGYSYSRDISLYGGTSNDPGTSDSTLYRIQAIHNTLGFYPVARYYETYPNFFAKNSNNVVNTDPLQVCFYSLRTDYINEQTGISKGLEIALEVARKYKDSYYIEISNMDTGGHCQCSHCSGNLGYQYFMFLNAYNALIKNDPDTQHMTLKGMVYAQNSSNPPVDEAGNPTVVLDSDIIITLALNYADYYAGFSAKDEEMISKWSKCISKIAFWTYCFRPNYSMFFFDDFTNKQKMYETLVKYNAIAIMDEGNKSSSVFTNFSQLRVYLGSKLAEYSGSDLSDAEASAYYAELTDKYFDNYFGPVSDKMRAVFEKQKEITQYMYNNWTGEDGIYQKAYVDSGVGFSGQESSIQPTNAWGNNSLGSYNSFAHHYWVSNKNHGNRLAFTFAYSREDFREMLGDCYDALDIISNDSSLSATKKTNLTNRVELEMIGIIYQFMFIYEDDFAVGNRTYSSHLLQEDLDALRVSSVYTGLQLFTSLCYKYGISSVNYLTISKLVELWGIGDGVIEDGDIWEKN